MIYPKNLNNKDNNNITLYILLFFSIILASMLITINKLTSPNIHWAALSNCGIIYIWVTVLYSIKSNTNIASHVLLQIFAISALVIYIDKQTGNFGWSLSIALPIIIMTANITMFILTVINYKRYIKYAIYQLFIIFISFIPILLIFKGIMKFNILLVVAISISILNLIFSLIICHKDIKEAIIRKLHM